MKLYLHGHDYKYAVEQIMLVLLPDQRPEYPEAGPSEGDIWARSALIRQGGFAVAETELSLGGEVVKASSQVEETAMSDQLTTDRLLQRILKQSFYKATVQLLDKAPDWGALTGIRPAKLASKALEEGLTEEEATQRFLNEYFVSPQRTRLAMEAAKAGLEIKESLKPEELSLYIGIPFCPTRCAYCSFVSADVQKALKLVEPFLEALDKEIDAVAEILPKAGAVIRSIYIGGGTPTTLSASQLDHLLSHVRSAFDLSRLSEFTVEAGRPDTITPEKMEVLYRHGVDRVSVNPQSMEDEVLQAMGRDHSAADIKVAYQMARDAKLPAVNMDLIAGLPKDTVEGFRYTMDTVLSMDPENITVHTLALKKGSRLMMERQGLPSGEETARMLDYAWVSLEKAGYRPYYLYRQKYMSGALENIGWCKPGFEGVYNVCIMEELHTILALGAGGSTKLTDPSTGKIVRMTNPKYPYEYIQRIDQICEEKAELIPFHQALISKEV
ncbi:MAG: coproporphyrinogen dehydrogenase HemZ [Oscillospiraceae bacterium]|nr:coproporphyrinogen dehydrogenase HemZ [Oscillospiraceae bacterium]